MISGGHIVDTAGAPPAAACGQPLEVGAPTRQTYSMKKLAWALPALVAIALVAPPERVARALPQGLEVQTYEGGVDFPIDMAWVKGTRRIFFTEKNTGRIRVMIGRRLLDRACGDLDVVSDGERGLLGIALHPNFKRNHYLYVMYTNRTPLEIRVTRFEVDENRCTNARHIVTGIDASSSGYHNGGQLEFVGSKLFVSTGEAHDPAEAQDTSNRLGKILRYNADGSIPSTNPFSTAAASNPVWSYGHRNPFGLAAKPNSKWLFETENGPSCDDELNRIKKGRNYGWGPNYSPTFCGTAGVGDDPKAPLFRWTPVIVPTDLWWYVGRLKRLSGDLYMGDFAEGRLHRFDLNATGSAVDDHTVIYDGDEGIVDVAKGPGGYLYFMTPTKILRIVPS